MARARGHAGDALAVTRPGDRRSPSPSGSAAGRRPLRPARAAGAAAISPPVRSRQATLLGWRIEANWTDPLLFFIYTVAKPVASAAAARRDDPDHRRRPQSREQRGVRGRGQRAVGDVIAGIAGPGLVGPRRPRALPDAQVRRTSARRDFLVVLAGPGRRAPRRRRDGRRGRARRSASSSWACGSTRGPSTGRCSSWSWLVGIVPVVAIGVVLAAICLQTRQESWPYPEAVAGAMFLVTGAVFPLAVLPYPVQLVGLADPITWWVEGVRGALFPGGPSSIGGAGRCGRLSPGPSAPDGLVVLAALLLTGARRYTRGDRDFRVERTSREGAGAARPDDRVVRATAAGSGRPRGEEPDADLRGQPAPGLRGGLPLDRGLHRQHGMRDILLAGGARRVHRPGPGVRRRDVGRLVRDLRHA